MTPANSNLSPVSIAAFEICRHFDVERIARQANQDRLDIDDVSGAFVTLKRRGRLRACYGCFRDRQSVPELIRMAAHSTVTKDRRFASFSNRELPFLSIDVSLLTPFEEVGGKPSRRDTAIDIGRHGVTISNGERSALLLPQVAPEWGWNATQLLEQLCRKAGLETNAWQSPSATLRTFESQIHEGELRDHLGSPEFNAPRHTVDQVHLVAAAEALRLSLDPNQGDSNTPDALHGWEHAKIAGGIARIHSRARDVAIRVGVIRLVEPYALDALLIALKSEFQRHPDCATLPAEEAISVDLSILFDVATHNVPLERADSDPSGDEQASELDIDGFQSEFDALIRCPNPSAPNASVTAIYDPNRTIDQLLEAMRHEHAKGPSRSSCWFSAQVVSTRPAEKWNGRAELLKSPTPSQHATSSCRIRPAVLAGRFYPSEPTELRAAVDRCFADVERRPQQVTAVQVPHAALVYSGGVAAKALAQIDFPGSIIVITPKHRREGANWSVCPCDEWKTVGHCFQSDVELGNRLVRGIDGLKFCDSAHQQEHGIEIQLPLLARLAPQSRVTGIAIGIASLQEALDFGRQLANVIRALESPPLLVISSDMNHFANDEENRRLDRIAIEALTSLDPQRVYQTVVEEHQITMCGVRPAVMVLAALRDLDRVHRCEQVAYATSGDAFGERDRVVGYAGLTFHD